MIGRQHDYKVKLLTDNDFYYAGDRYLHACGFEVSCHDFSHMLDEDFEKAMSVISEKIKEFESFRQQTLTDCQMIIDNIKF